jgi:hypothetical protein
LRDTRSIYLILLDSNIIIMFGEETLVRFLIMH